MSLAIVEAFESLARPAGIAERLREWAAGIDLRLDHARADAIREIAYEIERDGDFARICQRRIERAHDEEQW